MTDERRPEEVEDAAVRTLAETFFECGFGPNRAEAMARAVARLPEQGEDW